MPVGGPQHWTPKLGNTSLYNPDGAGWHSDFEFECAPDGVKRNPDSIKAFQKQLSKWPMKWRLQKLLEVSPMHHPAKPLYGLSVMFISRSIMGNFPQPVRRQGVQTLFTMRRREEWAKSQEDTLYRKGKGRKTCSTPPVQMKKKFNWMLFIEVKKNTPWSSQHFIIQLS